MRLVALAAAAVIAVVAPPALAQPDPANPAPATDDASFQQEVLKARRALEALSEARAARASLPAPTAPDPRLSRITSSGSRLRREPGQGVSNVRVELGCAGEGDLPLDGVCSIK